MASLIHKDSSPCTKSELFAMPQTQTALEKGYFVEYHPIASFRDGAPIEFNITGAGEDYCDLGSSYLHIKAKILQSDGTALPENEPVAPVNLFFQSLFSQVDVSLNERVVSSSNNIYPYRAYIETLLNYGEDAKKSLLSCECFYKDDNLDTVNPLQAEKKNVGLKKRYDLTEKSKVIDMIGQIHCDIFQQNRLLLNLVDLKVKLIRSKPQFCLLTAKANTEYKAELEHVSLFIRKCQLNPGVSLGHAKALEKSTAKYPIDRVLCKMYSVSSGACSFMQDNVFSGSLPKRVIIGCLKNAAVNGRYNLNPFLFEHFDVNFLSIYVDGNPVPAKGLELDFENKSYIRAYHQLFSSLKQDKGIYLTREDFANGYTLYQFDLTSDLCDGNHLNLQQQGNLRLELKFSKALSQTISVFIYAQFENVIEITKTRHVLCDSPN